jgi:hypothetical protein
LVVSCLDLSLWRMGGLGLLHFSGYVLLPAHHFEPVTLLGSAHLSSPLLSFSSLVHGRGHTGSFSVFAPCDSRDKQFTISV